MGYVTTDRLPGTREGSLLPTQRGRTELESQRGYSFSGVKEENERQHEGETVKRKDTQTDADS